MPKYYVSGQVIGSKYLGVIEAETEEAAKDAMYGEHSDLLYVSVCHQCASEVDDPSINEVSVSEAGEDEPVTIGAEIDEEEDDE